MRALLLASLGAFFLVPAVPAWACGTVSFSPQNYTVDENDGHVTLTITLALNNPESRNRTIPYNTKAGTAQAGKDFKPKSGSVTFSPGDTSQTLAIDIVNDPTHESVERFEVELKPGSSNQCIEAGSDALVTIQDDDPKPKPTPTRDEGTDPPPPGSEPDPSTGSDPGQVVSDPSLPVTETPTPTPTPTPSPTDAESSPSPEPADVSASGSFGEGGGLSAFALAGIAIGAIVIGSFAVAGVRRRFLATQTPS